MSLSAIADKAFFLYKFLKSPLQIGSVTPSSRYLIDQSLACLNWKTTKKIVQLGAGTGAFTKEIIKRINNNDTTFIAFEYDDHMRERLEANYPTITHAKDALLLDETLASYSIREVDCILSCLPLATFSHADRFRLVKQVKDSLTPEGIFIAYQYSLQMKGLLGEQFSEVQIHFAPFNIPPAFIYICRK